jgi:hypothetical protein
MAGAAKPTKVKLYVKLTSLKPTNSSVQFVLGHSNAAAASSGEIVAVCAGTTSVPFLDGTRVAVVVSLTEALCGSTMFALPGLRQTKSAVPVTVNERFAFVFPTPPICVVVQLTVIAPVVGTVLSVHTGTPKPCLKCAPDGALSSCWARADEDEKAMKSIESTAVSPSRFTDTSFP